MGRRKKGNSSLSLPIKLDKGLEIQYLSFWAVWNCQLMIIEYLSFSIEDKFECLFSNPLTNASQCLVFTFTLIPVPNWRHKSNTIAASRFSAGRRDWKENLFKTENNSLRADHRERTSSGIFKPVLIRNIKQKLLEIFLAGPRLCSSKHAVNILKSQTSQTQALPDPLADNTDARRKGSNTCCLTFIPVGIKLILINRLGNRWVPWQSL